MGDDNGSGLSSMSVCLHFYSANASSSVFGTRTQCGSHFENPTDFKILKEPLLVQKQTYITKKFLISAIWSLRDKCGALS